MENLAHSTGESKENVRPYHKDHVARLFGLVDERKFNPSSTPQHLDRELFAVTSYGGFILGDR